MKTKLISVLKPRFYLYLIYKGVRKLNEEEKKVAPELKNIPFQLQITYVDQTGAKALRFV